MLGRTMVKGNIDVKIDEMVLNIREDKFASKIIGAILRILLSLHLTIPALSRLLSENAPATATSCPLNLQYSAKNSILLQAALGFSFLILP